MLSNERLTRLSWLPVSTISAGTFRYGNDFHLNQTTALLTANLFYAAMYRKSTEGFQFNTVAETKIDEAGKDPDGGDAKVIFDDETNALLHNAACDAAMQFN